MKITNKIKTFQDACTILGIGRLDMFPNLPSYMISYVEFHEASIKLSIITRALNEGWIPDWDNSKERKYYPYFTMNSVPGFGLNGVSTLVDNSSVASRLVYKNEELCRYCATQFKDIWEVYMGYNKK